MDNRKLYDEVMVKLAEAQNCQTEIINCNNQSQEIIRERDAKLNEALSKALEIADDEIYKNMFNPCSLGSQAICNIFGFMALYNINIHPSAEVQAKIAEFTADGINKFMFDISKFGW